MKKLTSTSSIPAIKKLDAHNWLPFCAPIYKISKDIKDYLVVPVVAFISDLPNTNGDCITLDQVLAFNPQRGMPFYMTFKGMPVQVEHCFTENTSVLCDTGYTGIQKVALGDKVWTSQGFKAVTSKFTQTAKVSSVQLFGMPNTFATANHPYLVGQDFVEVCNLDNSMFVTVPITVGGTVAVDDNTAYNVGRYYSNFLNFKDLSYQDLCEWDNTAYQHLISGFLSEDRRVSLPTALLFQNIGARLGKTLKIERLGKHYTLYKCNHSGMYVDETNLYVQVQKVCPKQKLQTVYNLEVEDAHTYTANGCCVHNCNKNYHTAVGVVLDAYVSPLAGFEGGHGKVVLLAAIDKTKNRELANRVLTGKINTYSIGARYTEYMCSVTGNVYKQGIAPGKFTKPGVPTYMLNNGQLVFRKLCNLDGFELSIVENPAYCSAVSDHIIDMGNSLFTFCS